MQRKLIIKLVLREIWSKLPQELFVEALANIAKLLFALVNCWTLTIDFFVGCAWTSSAKEREADSENLLKCGDMKCNEFTLQDARNKHTLNLQRKDHPKYVKLIN